MRKATTNTIITGLVLLTAAVLLSLCTQQVLAAHSETFTCTVEPRHKASLDLAYDEVAKGNKDVIVYDTEADIKNFFAIVSRVLKKKVPFEGETAVVLDIVRFKANNQVAFVRLWGFHGEDKCLMGINQMPLKIWLQVEAEIKGL